MQRLEVRSAVRPIYGSLGVKRLMDKQICERSFYIFRHDMVCALVAVWGKDWQREELKKQQTCVWKGKIKEK